jgi:hypothetical protein
MTELSIEKKEKRIFNLEYLNTLLTRDSATLTGTYPNLNSTIKINFICSCGNEYEKKFNEISYYGGAFCKKCTTKNKVRKIRDTTLEHFGVENPSQAKEVKELKNKTYIEHFGDHPKRTKDVQDKYINTCLEKYGCVNSAQAVHVKEKIKQTFDELYQGHPMFINTVKEKVKNTCIDRYGGHPAKSDEVKEKTKSTNINKYGCHPSQTVEVHNKLVHSSKSYKKYTLPSGKEINVQGYEPFALNILLKEYNEEKIKTDRCNIPRINYNYNGENKIYFPDIYLPDINLIIEVKSDWIYNLELEKNKMKEKATIEAGYLYEIWKFDNKGNKLNI